MDDLERDRSFLTSNEKKMIVRVHQYFLSIRQRQTQRQDLSLRKEVASVLGIGEATVARVVAEYNGSENEEFSRQTIQGRPKKGLQVIRYWLKVIMKILKSEKLNVNNFL